MQNNNTKIILEFKHSIDYLHAMKKIGNIVKDAYEIVNNNLVKLGVIGATALASFLPMKIEAQTPILASRYVMNPFNQPNDSTDNYYGSGNLVDYNKRYDINQTDVNRLEDILKGSYSDPSDTRLRARADVNGDGNVTYSDKELLQEYVNGTIDYLPGHWNKLNPAEKKEWFEKTIYLSGLDKVCEGLPANECDCNNYAFTAHMVNYGSDKESFELQEEFFTNEDFKKKNGLYNIPLLITNTDDNNSEGIRTGGHAMNALVIGDEVSYENIYNYDPQKGARDLEAGEEYFIIGETGNAYIFGPPPALPPIEIIATRYLEYNFNQDKNPNLVYTLPDSEQDVKFIQRVDNNSPNISISKPAQGEITNDPRFVSTVTDATIFDRYEMVDGQKVYYNKNNSFSIDGVKSNEPVFNYTNRSLEGLSDGEHTISVTSIDEFENESTLTRTFIVDKQVPVFNSPSPTPDSTYKAKNVNFVYSAEDENLDLSKSYYEFNGVQNSFSKATDTIPLTSKEGRNKLEIYLFDKAGNYSTHQKEYEYSSETPVEDISQENKKSKAYPNPAKDYIRFEIENNSGRESEVEMYDVSGRLIGSKKTKENYIDYDISDYSRGLIIYRIKDSSGKTIDSGKTIKE